LHGANRLASNSLLEGAVFGHRVAEAILDPGVAGLPQEPDRRRWAEPLELDASPGPEAFGRTDLQHLMWESAGLVRDADGLAEAADVPAPCAPPAVTAAKSAEDANLWLAARAVVASAAARRESRGGHHRRDVPRTDPAYARHSTLRMVA